MCFCNRFLALGTQPDASKSLSHHDFPGSAQPAPSSSGFPTLRQDRHRHRDRLALACSAVCFSTFPQSFYLLTWWRVSFYSLFLLGSDIKSEEQEETTGLRNVSDTQAWVYLPDHRALLRHPEWAAYALWGSLSQSVKRRPRHLPQRQVLTSRDPMSTCTPYNAPDLYFIHFQTQLVLRTICSLAYWLGYNFYFHPLL